MIRTTLQQPLSKISVKKKKINKKKRKNRSQFKREGEVEKNRDESRDSHVSMSRCDLQA